MLTRSDPQLSAMQAVSSYPGVPPDSNSTAASYPRELVYPTVIPSQDDRVTSFTQPEAPSAGLGSSPSVASYGSAAMQLAAMSPSAYASPFPPQSGGRTSRPTSERAPAPLSPGSYNSSFTHTSAAPPSIANPQGHSNFSTIRSGTSKSYGPSNTPSQANLSRTLRQPASTRGATGNYAMQASSLASKGGSTARGGGRGRSRAGSDSTRGRDSHAVSATSPVSQWTATRAPRKSNQAHHRKQGPAPIAEASSGDSESEESEESES